MSNHQTTGLGEPDPIGKKSLFQPPTASNPSPARLDRPTIKPSSSQNPHVARYHKEIIGDHARSPEQISP